MRARVVGFVLDMDVVGWEGVGSVSVGVDVCLQQLYPYCSKQMGNSM